MNEVLKKVHKEEKAGPRLRRKGWPKVEGWIAEEETSSSGEDDLVNLGVEVLGHQFQTAKEEGEEFVKI